MGSVFVWGAEKQRGLVGGILVCMGQWGVGFDSVVVLRCPLFFLLAYWCYLYLHMYFVVSFEGL